MSTVFRKECDLVVGDWTISDFLFRNVGDFLRKGNTNRSVHALTQ